jgi:hypothetical protein
MELVAPSRPPASEAEAIHILPALYASCHAMVFSDGPASDVHGRRRHALTLAEHVAPTWGAFFTKETFNRSVTGDGAADLHLRVFSELASWLGAFLHLQLALTESLEGNHWAIDALRGSMDGSQQFIGDEPCLWLDGALRGSNRSDNLGKVRCQAVTSTGRIVMGAPFDRPLSHKPVWYEFEGTKLVLNRRQEDADKLLDPGGRCWFCQDKIIPEEEAHWLLALRGGSSSIALHETCMFLPTRKLEQQGRVDEVNSSEEQPINSPPRTDDEDLFGVDPTWEPWQQKVMRMGSLVFGAIFVGIGLCMALMVLIKGQGSFLVRVFPGLLYPGAAMVIGGGILGKAILSFRARKKQLEEAKALEARR